MYEVSSMLYRLPLPSNVITNILLYDNRFAFVNGEFIIIQKIDKKDKRYSILIKKRPLIFISKDRYYGFSTINKYFHNTITIYTNIVDKCVFEQYKYIHESIKMANFM